MQATDSIFIENEQVIGFDCDDTLILHKIPEPGDETVDIIDPYDHKLMRFVIHKPHLKLLKDRLARGCAIMVWSQAGPQWAKAVSDALKITPTLIISKPFLIVDDLPSSSWLQNRIYIDATATYGSEKLIITESPARPVEKTSG